MRLGWNRDEDGVITVFASASDGRGAPIADFWLQPLIDKLGMARTDAKELQQQFAEMLVGLHNRHFTKPAGSKWECPLGRPDCKENCGNYCCGN